MAGVARGARTVEMTSALRRAVPTFACLFCVLFYWRALTCPFYMDDYGWLHLGLGPHPWPASDLLGLLFAPKAHNMIRPWSQSLFFWGLARLFGVNPLPFHVVIFATIIANLLLLYAIVRRLTGSIIAALGAQFFWMLNPGLGGAFAWTCLYNEPQFAFFMLLALWLFMNGRYWWQLAVFIIGLGSLEAAVMYPGVASLYALIYDRRKLRSTLPLYLVSAGFVAAVFIWATPAHSGPYSMHVDARIFTTLKTYVEFALGPERFGHFHWTWPAWIISAGSVVMFLGVVAAMFAAGRAGLFGAGCFLILLAPFLVLPDHVFEFYLTGPAIGLAIALGAALASRWRVPALAFGAVYLLIAIPPAWQVTKWYYERSVLGRDLVDSVVEYNRAHPGKTLLLTGMDIDQFESSFVNIPLELYGMQNVWLAPGADAKINDATHFAPLFVPKNARALLDSGQAVVLDVSRGAAIRDVTSIFASAPAPAR